MTMIGLDEVLFACNTLAFAIYAPYTKVEESFNIQACHDILRYGVSLGDLWRWDHQEFPGAVPRTFVGALVLSGLTSLPLQSLAALGWTLTGSHAQSLVRYTLGLVNAVSMIHLKRTIARVHGKENATFYLALQGTQFHFMYYASRTLPNFLAFPLTTIATAQLIQHKPYKAISLLTFATVIFRSEILILLGSIVLWLLYENQVTFFPTAKIGMISGSLALLVSGVVDSIIWGYPVVPELSGVMYNVIQGKSSDWGISPWYTYALDIMKLLLNPLSLPLIVYALSRNRRATMHLLPPFLGFLFLYSFQPHKEWRFIVYVVPGLTYMASIGATQLYIRRSKHVIYRCLTVLLLASIPCTALLSHGMGMISMMNYPGGEMMTRIPQTTQTVYLDVLTCMTGSTRFLRQNGTYERSENVELLRSVKFWDELGYASVQDPGAIISHDDRWRVIDRVYGFDGVDLRHLRLKKAIKLYLLENTKRTC